MNDFITSVIANWPTILGVITGLVGVFALVAKLTPTPKDDGIAAAIMRFLNLLPQASPTKKEDEPKSDKPTPLI